MNTKQGYLFKPNAYILEMFRTGKCILNPACHKFFAKLHLLSNISKTNIGMQLCGKKGKFMTWNLPKAIRQHWLLLRQNVVQTRKLTKNCTEISSSYCVSHHELLYELRLSYNKTMKICSVNGETCHNEESPVSICYTKYPHRKKQLQQDRFIFIATEKRYIYRNCSGMKECRFLSRPKNPSLEFHLYLYCLLPKGFRLTGNVFIEIVRRRPHIQNSLS